MSGRRHLSRSALVDLVLALWVLPVLLGNGYLGWRVATAVSSVHKTLSVCVWSRNVAAESLKIYGDEGGHSGDGAVVVSE